MLPIVYYFFDKVPKMDSMYKCIVGLQGLFNIEIEVVYLPWSNFTKLEKKYCKPPI